MTQRIYLQLTWQQSSLLSRVKRPSYMPTRLSTESKSPFFLLRPCESLPTLPYHRHFGSSCVISRLHILSHADQARNSGIDKFGHKNVDDSI